jgi:hypothetical protein
MNRRIVIEVELDATEEVTQELRVALHGAAWQAMKDSSLRTPMQLRSHHVKLAGSNNLNREAVGA